MLAANKNKLEINSMGTATIKLKLKGEEKQIKAKEVLYSSDAAVNILSVNKICNKGHKVVFNKYGGKIYDLLGELVATASESNGIYKLDTIEKKSNNEVVHLAVQEDKLWHRRLGNTNRKNMIVLNKLQQINCNRYTEETCEICIEGKQSRQPFERSMNKSTEVLELVHPDLCGPMETTSIGGSKYFITFIDDYSRKIFVFIIKSKDEVLEMFKIFKNMCEKQTGKKIKKLRSDNGKNI